MKRDNPNDQPTAYGWPERLRAGDPDAFTELSAAWYGGLFDFAASITGDRFVAEDVVQDVLLNVWEMRRTLSPQTTLRAYLFRAVRNRALNERRRKAAFSDAQHELPGTGSDPHAVVQYDHLLADYRRAIAELPERRQLVFRLCRLYGLSYDECASVLGISVNTVRTQMSDALRHIRLALADYLT